MTLGWWKWSLHSKNNLYLCVCVCVCMYIQGRRWHWGRGGHDPPRFIVTRSVPLTVSTKGDIGKQRMDHWGFPLVAARTAAPLNVHEAIFEKRFWRSARPSPKTHLQPTSSKGVCLVLIDRKERSIWVYRMDISRSTTDREKWQIKKEENIKRNKTLKRRVMIRQEVGPA